MSYKYVDQPSLKELVSLKGYFGKTNFIAVMQHYGGDKQYYPIDFFQEVGTPAYDWIVAVDKATGKLVIQCTESWKDSNSLTKLTIYRVDRNKTLKATKGITTLLRRKWALINREAIDNIASFYGDKIEWSKIK